MISAYRNIISSNGPPTPAAIEVGWRRPLAFGYAVIFLSFGVLGTWAALAPLDSAVIGPAVIAVESSRKNVQHYDGGIIKEILVRDGDLVQAGALLFRLDDNYARSQLELNANQLTAALAREARLVAERDGLSSIDFPNEVTDIGATPIAAAVMQDETKNFKERRAVLTAQIDAQREQQEAWRKETGGLKLEYHSSISQIEQIDRELPGLKVLLEKGYVALTRVTTLVRERIRLEGVAGRSQTDLAKAEISIAQFETQIAQLNATFQQSVASDLVDTRKAISDLRDKIIIANDMLRRTEIRSPQTGVAQGRKISTVGAVIKPGDVLVDIAPVNDRLIIQAQIDPKDVNVVKTGMKAQVTFTGFKATETPVMSGIVRSLTNDRVSDPVNPNLVYFAAEVEVDMTTVPDDVQKRLRPGMDAQVLIPTGPRTVLRYIFEPIEDRLRNAFREK